MTQEQLNSIMDHVISIEDTTQRTMIYDIIQDYYKISNNPNCEVESHTDSLTKSNIIISISGLDGDRSLRQDILESVLDAFEIK